METLERPPQLGPELLQSNFTLNMTVQSMNDVEEDYIKYTYIYNDNPTGTGSIRARISPEHNKWIAPWGTIFPYSTKTYGELPVSKRSGYGTLVHTASLIGLMEYYGKEFISQMLLGRDIERSVSSERRAHENFMGIDSMKLYNSYEYMLLSLQAAKSKGFKFNTYTVTKNTSYKENSRIYELSFKFPYSDLNILDCQACILHNSNCRLNKIMSVNELYEILDRDAPVEKYSTRVTKGTVWQKKFLRNNIYIDRKGNIAGECYDPEGNSGSMFGQYPPIKR